jgi:hypothetical protein
MHFLTGCLRTAPQDGVSKILCSVYIPYRVQSKPLSGVITVDRHDFSHYPIH